MVSGGCLERRIPGKNEKGTPRIFLTNPPPSPRERQIWVSGRAKQSGKLCRPRCSPGRGFRPQTARTGRFGPATAEIDFPVNQRVPKRVPSLKTKRSQVRLGACQNVDTSEKWCCLCAPHGHSLRLFLIASQTHRVSFSHVQKLAQQGTHLFILHLFSFFFLSGADRQARKGDHCHSPPLCHHVQTVSEKRLRRAKPPPVPSVLLRKTRVSLYQSEYGTEPQQETVTPIRRIPDEHRMF